MERNFLWSDFNTLKKEIAYPDVPIVMMEKDGHYGNHIQGQGILLCGGHSGIRAVTTVPDIPAKVLSTGLKVKMDYRGKIRK